MNRRWTAALLSTLAFAISACVQPNSPSITTPEGNWSDPTTWGGTVPRDGSNVTVPAGQTILLDRSIKLGHLIVHGTLRFADMDLNLSADWIMVHGSLQIGSAAAPYTKKAIITLTGTGGDTDATGMGMGNRVLGVMGGSLELHGSSRSKLSWTKLSATAGIGATALTLDRPANWQPGDRIVIASSDFDPGQAEEVKVLSVTGNSVTFEPPLKHRHWGTEQTFGTKSIDTRAEVGLLSRNIVIQGDAASETAGFGGQVMIMAGGTARAEGVELYRMGQKGLLKRYPWHWHMLGQADGQYLRSSSVHHAFNRFVTVHGSDGVTLENNVAYNTFGHGYFLEDGIEQRSSFLRNLGLLTRRSDKPLLPDSDDAPATFWITNPNNRFVDNVAAGSEGNGFWIQVPEHPTGLSADETVWPQRLPLFEFRDNASHSNLALSRGQVRGNGLVSQGISPTSGTVQDFTTYKNAGSGVWSEGLTLSGARIADSKTGLANRNGVSTVTDSLFVGVSALDTGEFPNGPGEWGDQAIVAMENYDGRGVMNGVTFANYRDYRQRDGTTRLSGIIGFSDSRVADEGATFERSETTNANLAGFKPAFEYNPADPTEPKRMINFVDVDGTLSGTGQFSTVVYNHALQLTENCQRVFERASVCPGNHYVGVNIVPYGTAKLELRRDDGAMGALAAWVAPNGGHVGYGVPLANRRYALLSSVATPAHVTLEMAAAHEEDWIQLAVPYDSDSVWVSYGGNEDFVKQVPRLADLETEVGRGIYFLDAFNDLLYVRLRATAGVYQVSVHVCQRQNCQ